MGPVEMPQKHTLKMHHMHYYSSNAPSEDSLVCNHTTKGAFSSSQVCCETFKKPFPHQHLQEMHKRSSISILILYNVFRFLYEARGPLWTRGLRCESEMVWELQKEQRKCELTPTFFLLSHTRNHCMSCASGWHIIKH